MTESTGDQPAASRTDHWLCRFLHVREGEVAAALWSFAYFFCLLCGYYVLRPVRDEMGVQAGLERLPWLFSTVFVVMLAVVPVFGWISARFPRRRFLPLVYLFFVANLALFWGLFAAGVAARAATMAFFVWVSAFNLFVVSVFWSFMADLYDTAQARRLYGFIAAGGTAGAIAGPALTTFLARPLGPVNLITLALQLLVFQRFMERLGLAAALVIVPLVSLAGFGVLGLHSTLAVLVVFGVLRRAGEFALAKPARETLFNVLAREEKYKAKNFMDTVVYRGGDAASAWLATGLRALGAGMAGIAFLAMPLAALWALTGAWLARRHARLRAAAGTGDTRRSDE